MVHALLRAKTVPHPLSPPSTTTQTTNKAFIEQGLGNLSPRMYWLECVMIYIIQPNSNTITISNQVSGRHPPPTRVDASVRQLDCQRMLAVTQVSLWLSASYLAE